MPLLAVLVLFVGLAGAGHAHASIDPISFEESPFCASNEIIRDFGIDRLGTVHEVPDDGDLPFAPPSVSVYAPTIGRILTERGSYGLGFFEENYRGTVRLDWTVTAQMWALDRRGEPLREVDRGTVAIGRLDALDQPNLLLETGGRRGFYRYDIQFADRGGEALGSYSTYLKLVRPFWKARLGLDRSVYRPGQLVLSRPENLGTKWAIYGESYGVQRRERGGWVPAPALRQGFWLAWLGMAAPGTSGRCSALRLPADVARGRYRIVKHLGEQVSPRRSRSHWLTAPFTVR